MAKAPAVEVEVEVEVGGRSVRISNPDRVYFPALGMTKLGLVDDDVAVGPGIGNALRERRARGTGSPRASTATRSTRSGCPAVPRPGSRP